LTKKRLVLDLKMMRRFRLLIFIEWPAHSARVYAKVRERQC
jgi:hypothetical protein